MSESPVAKVKQESYACDEVLSLNLSRPQKAADPLFLDVIRGHDLM
jgi:hypothetical protein